MDLMTLFKTFVTLNEQGTMSKTADVLTYAQPTVSLHLKALEEYYGVPLAEFKGRRYALTEEGQVLHQYATTILHLTNEATDALTEFKTLERGSLKVGATSNIGVYVLPGVLSLFRCRYPGVKVTVLIDKSWVIQAQVQQGELGVGIVEAHVEESPHLVVEPWQDDPLVLIVSPRHPWSAAGEVAPEQLADEPFVTGERGSGTQSVLEAQLGPVARTLRVALELGSTEAVKRAVESDLGVSIVTQSSVAREVAAGILTTIPIRNVVLHKTFSLVYPRNRYLTSVTKSFLTEIRRLRGTSLPLGTVDCAQSGGRDDPGHGAN